MVLKGLLKIASYFKLDSLGFIFAKEQKFQVGIESVLNNAIVPNAKMFAEHIKLHRQGWYAEFISIRDKIEHEGFKLPDINFGLNTKDEVVIFFPTIGNKSVEDFLDVLWHNLVIFCEDTLMFLFASKLPKGYVIAPAPQDKSQNPNGIKYQVELINFPGVKLSC